MKIPSWLKKDKVLTGGAMTAPAPSGISFLQAGSKHIDTFTHSTEKKPNLFNKIGSSIADRVKAVGHSLNDPEVRKTMAKEIAISATLMTATKLAIGATLTATQAPTLVAFAALTAGTGVVGGLLKSNREYNRAKSAWERNSEHEGRFQSRHSYLWENRAKLGKNMLSSAFMGAIGSGIGTVAGHLLQNLPIFHAPESADLLANHGQVATHTTVTTPHAAPEIQLTAIQKAAAAVLEDENASEYAKYCAEEALKGRAWAQTNLAHFLNNAKEGVDLDKSLAHDVVKEVVTEDKASSTIARLANKMLAHMEGRPVPAHTGVAPSTSHATHLAVEEDKPWYHWPAKDDAGTVATEELPAETVPLVNAPAATTEPPVASTVTQTVAPAKPVIISSCKLTDIASAPDAYGMKCSAVSDTQMMQAPYKVRVNYTNPQGFTATEDVSLRSDLAPMKANAFQSWFQNDKGFMNGMQERLRGIAKHKFQVATGQIPSAPVQALNDNIQTANDQVLASTSNPPKIYAFK